MRISGALCLVLFAGGCLPGQTRPSRPLPNVLLIQDSFNLLPVLLGTAGETPVRPYTLQQTVSLALSIRRGPWKYLDHKGSGGNSYEAGDLAPYALPETEPEAPGQLYNLDADRGERTNLAFRHPEIVKELKGRLDEFRASGRSAPPR